ASPDLRVQRVSALREYPPVGGPPQPPYLNAVAEVITTLAPLDLLRRLQALEREAGRPRPDPVRWGPRLLDLDLLLHDNQVIHTPELTVPHPRLAERLFVVEPLAELAPDLIHPVLRLSVATLLARMKDSR
ncbi:MAG: 2-amino-4-hydroxy-6-hydroxymethyldihydropteridine diphosphokinase, partial [Candidatus Omnitrophica bacterium]|nr:2-amino-4-hydroxy-6-hydroxymethyldihydropteridine diphosphokinase [Candidatus Omnitrophota bacterium]